MKPRAVLLGALIAVAAILGLRAAFFSHDPAVPSAAAKPGASPQTAAPDDRPLR